MSAYIATFHTHLAALRSYKRLSAAGRPARQMPVPRVLSSSCGTCVSYEGDGDGRELLDMDLEAIYERVGEEYRLLLEGTE